MAAVLTTRLPKWFMPNFFLTRPRPEWIESVLRREKASHLSYDIVGHTSSGAPGGKWDWHEEALTLGTGGETWARACVALRGWTQFKMSWVTPFDATVPLEVGEHFAFISQQMGVWSVNVCRIVYTIDEGDDAEQRFGFAYGTLASHAVRGEEQFLLRWDTATDEVTFSIRKFSQPAALITRVVAPLTRSIQAKFTHDALRRLAQEVST